MSVVCVVNLLIKWNLMQLYGMKFVIYNLMLNFAIMNLQLLMLMLNLQY